MPLWKFIHGLDKSTIKSLIDPIDPRWVSALEAALQSRATPSQSGYHVNTGAVTRNGKIVLGSNHEMAITDTITHGEEAVIAAALDKYGKDDPIQIIAFAGLGGGDIGRPCGNCRDAIRQYTDLDNLVIINAPRDGGLAVLVPGKAFFKSDFDEIYGEEKTRILSSEAAKQALVAERNAYDVYVTKTSPQIYGAAIACGNGAVFRGSYRGNVAYHPVLPLSAAIGNFRDGSNDPQRNEITMIVVMASGAIPEVMYKDRQDALEFAEAMQSLNGRSGIPLPVYLINTWDGREMGNGEQRTRVCKTDTHEWLPLSFSPRALGLENAIAGGYDKLFRTM